MERRVEARPSTLRAQLLLRLLPPVLLVVFVSAFFAYRLGLGYATDAYDTALFDTARSLAQQIEIRPDGTPALTLPREAQEIILSDPYDRIFYRVVAADGNTVAGDARVPLSRDSASEENPVSFYDATMEGEPVRVGAYTLFAKSSRPAATVIVAETLVKRRRLSNSLLLALTLPLLLVTSLVVGLVWYGIRRGLAPLDALASVLAKRGWGDLRGVGSERVPNEVRPLIDALNSLMKRLDAAHAAQQRFISEAAHQLRTPLAGLTAQTERALLARDIDSIKPALAQLQSSSRRVNRLVSQLLTMAKAEPGNDPQHELAPLDLAKIVQETCRQWVPEALSRNVDLGFAGETAPFLINGHEFLSAEMLNNLIDNALRYAAHPGSVVTVRLLRDPRVEIAVEDEGPGIPDAERARVFERFHRLPGSAGGGCGLGLAIVREIALLHGADVRVEAGPGGRGSTFRVVFRTSASEVQPGAAKAA